MKLLKAEVEWHIGYSNAPDLVLHLDTIPKGDEFEFEQRGPLYYAEKDGFVRFYAYQKPGSGFGGREFRIRMKDGEERVLKGPWSSRSGCMNRAGFGPCVDVTFVADGFRGYGAVTLELAQQAAEMAGVTLERQEPYGSGDDVVWKIIDEKPEGERTQAGVCMPAY